MGARMRAKDWSATPLGPPSTWPQNLKTCLRIILTSRQPMFVWWGDQLVNLYNDAYKSIVGGKHPDALGQPASVVWREIWDQIGPRAERTMGGTEGTYDEALLLIMERNGYREETYYTFSYSPVPDDRGGAGGILCANTDDTRRIVGERQIALLRDLATRTGDAKRIDEAVALAAQSLESNPHDLPFALIYLAEPEKGRAVLSGTAGIPRGHRAAVDVVPLEGDAPWPVGDVTTAHEPCTVEDPRARFGDLPAGAWPEAPTRALALPIAPSGRTGRAGVLVVGLNPFRLLDDDYRGFLTLVASQIAAGIANAQAYEEERQRAEALERARSRQDHVLQQREPRVSHSAHAHARSRRGRARIRSRARSPARISIPFTEMRCGCSSWSTRCSTSRASRRGARAPCTSDRSARAHRRAGEQLPVRHRAGRARLPGRV